MVCAWRGFVCTHKGVCSACAYSCSSCATCKLPEEAGAAPRPPSCWPQLYLLTPSSYLCLVPPQGERPCPPAMPCVLPAPRVPVPYPLQMGLIQDWTHPAWADPRFSGSSPASRPLGRKGWAPTQGSRRVAILLEALGGGGGVGWGVAVCPCAPPSGLEHRRPCPCATWPTFPVCPHRLQASGHLPALPWRITTNQLLMV